jgi:hypothetical protein
VLPVTAVPPQAESPRAAQMRSADRVRKRLLLEVDPTLGGRHEIDAFDPNRTWTMKASLLPEGGRAILQVSPRR